MRDSLNHSVTCRCKYLHLKKKKNQRKSKNKDNKNCCCFTFKHVIDYIKSQIIYFICYYLQIVSGKNKISLKHYLQELKSILKLLILIKKCSIFYYFEKFDTDR